MKYESIDKIKVSSKLDNIIRDAIEEGYKGKGESKMKNNWKKKVASAAATMVIGTTALGMAFPAYAKDIPVIGNIFSYLSENKKGNYMDYKEYSKSLDMTQEDKGIKITLNDAIYDGRTVMTTYTIESEKDLGDKISAKGDLSIEGYKGGMTGSSGVYKVKENTYVGFTRMSIDEAKEDLNVKLKFEGVNNHNDLDINGDWSFKFNLKKSDADIMMVNKSTTKEGVNLNIEKITFTPMSTILYYSQQVSEEELNGYHSVDINLVEVKDDLGNVYSGEGDGGYGTKNIMNWTSTYEKIDENATKLIITPKAEFTVLAKNGQRIISPSALKNKHMDKEVLEYLKEKGPMPKEMILDDIVIDLK